MFHFLFNLAQDFLFSSFLVTCITAQKSHDLELIFKIKLGTVKGVKRNKNLTVVAKQPVDSIIMWKM